MFSIGCNPCCRPTACVFLPLLCGLSLLAAGVFLGAAFAQTGHAATAAFDVATSDVATFDVATFDAAVFESQNKNGSSALALDPFGIWLRGQDLNLRPSGYEPDELPDCSTPRLKE